MNEVFLCHVDDSEDNIFFVVCATFAAGVREINKYMTELLGEEEAEELPLITTDDARWSGWKNDWPNEPPDTNRLQLRDNYAVRIWRWVPVV